MNAFTAPRGPSLACRLKAPRIHKQVDRNPPPTGFFLPTKLEQQQQAIKTSALRLARI